MMDEAIEKITNAGYKLVYANADDETITVKSKNGKTIKIVFAGFAVYLECGSMENGPHWDIENALKEIDSI